MRILFKIIIGFVVASFLKQDSKEQAVPSSESGNTIKTIFGEKVKKNRKHVLFENFVFFFPLLYTFLLPVLFIWYPDAVTAWLEAWHILFGNLPAIAAFISEAQPMVDKHGQSMPYSYYIHGFWICFGATSLGVYGLCRVLKTDKWRLSGVDRLGYKAFHFLSLGTFCFFFLFVFIVFGGWGLGLLFEYSETGHMGVIFSTWLGFQYKPVFLIFGGFMFAFFAFVCVLNLMSYYFNSPRLLRWLKHKGE